MQNVYPLAQRKRSTSRCPSKAAQRTGVMESSSLVLASLREIVLNISKTPSLAALFIRDYDFINLYKIST